jgi:hypothetical protein
MTEFSRAISRQDTVVTVSDTSRIRGGKVGDFVNIDTVISLSSPEPKEITLVLPTITNNPQHAYLRTFKELENRQEFQSPVDPERLASLPQEERVILEKRVEAIRKEWNLAKEEAEKFPVSTINLDSGTQELKFFMQQEINPIKNDEGEIFELSFVAPQSNFNVTQGRFTMSVIIILPKGASLHGQPEAINPNGVQPVLEYNDKTANIDRQILQYSMQYDPIFTIRYKY